MKIYAVIHAPIVGAPASGRHLRLPDTELIFYVVLGFCWFLGWFAPGPPPCGRWSGALLFPFFSPLLLYGLGSL